MNLLRQARARQAKHLERMRTLDGFTDADGVLQIGSRGKPVVVFLHAAACTRFSFLPQMDELRDVFHCISIDAEGHGSLAGDDRPWAMAPWCAAVAHLPQASRPTNPQTSCSGRHLDLLGVRVLAARQRGQVSGRASHPNGSREGAAGRHVAWRLHRDGDCAAASGARRGSLPLGLHQRFHRRCASPVQATHRGRRLRGQDASGTRRSRRAAAAARRAQRVAA
eukprot:5605594-Prymnesium_polylepis.1